jgi:hypothetical protein
MLHRGYLHVVRGLRHVLVFPHGFSLGNCRIGDFYLTLWPMCGVKSTVDDTTSLVPLLDR